MTVKAWSASIEQEAQNHQNSLTKPQGSLGKLEEIACWFASRQGKRIPDPLQPHIAIFAADHGVTSEGISAFPAVVTGEMVKNFSRGGAAINVLARQVNATISVVDVGVIADLSDEKGIVHAKVRAGTTNLLHEAAMSEEECLKAMDIGRQEARKAIIQGANILVAGDMGIGNTTASACMICLFTGHTPEEVVGHGTGIDDQTYNHKVNIVSRATKRIRDKQSVPEHYLREAGGLEIAAICGFYLEAASQGIPVIIDGFITSAAALAAQSIERDAADWMLASHISKENGHIYALEQLQLTPLIDFNLRLGEGSGAALILPLLQSSLALHREMATFEGAGVSGKEKG